MTNFSELIIDDGVTSFSETLVKIRYRFRAPATQTGVTNTDSIVKLRRFFRDFTETVITHTDEVLRTYPVTATDIGVDSFSDGFGSRNLSRLRSDTGMTFSESFYRSRARWLTTSSTGLSLTDSIRADIGVVRYNTNQFSNLEITRNWSILLIDYDGWTYTSERNYELEVVT